MRWKSWHFLQLRLILLFTLSIFECEHAVAEIEARGPELESCGVEKVSPATTSHGTGAGTSIVVSGFVPGRRYYSSTGSNPRRGQVSQFHHSYGRSAPLALAPESFEVKSHGGNSTLGRTFDADQGLDSEPESNTEPEPGLEEDAESRGYPDEILVCQIRTLHSGLNLANLTSSVPGKSAERIVKLRLECNDLLFFESILVSGQLNSFRNLEKLEISKCKLSELTAETFRGLERLRFLRINTGNADWAPRSLRIAEGGFAPVTYTLETLDLALNNIWNLPTGFLCEIRSVRTLNLTRNLLSGINDLGFPQGASGSFSCPGLELKSLDLSWNTIQNLEGAKLGDVAKRLEVVRLDHNLLQEVPSGAFQGLESLLLLNLSSNRISGLPHNVFHSTRNLRELWLGNNSLSELTSVNLLKNLDQLQVLDLSWNRLAGEWVTLGVFHHLYRLVILNLSHNLLTRVSSLAFRDLGSVQSLDLSYNQIYAIEDGSFSRCNNLHVLNLSNNRLKSIASWTLSGMPSLRKLFLDDNEILDVAPDVFLNASSLQDLGLANNRLVKVPSSLRYLKRLETLDLGENRLSVVGNDTWYGLGQLYGLRLVGNELEEIPVGFCQFIRRLRALNLAGNRITKISLPAFRSCPDLRVLRLDSNKISLLPPTLPAELPNLLWLNVSRNYIRWLDYGWLPRKLEWLDISHNLLESLWGAPRSSFSVPQSYRVSDQQQQLLLLEVPQTEFQHRGLSSNDVGASTGARIAGEIWRSGRMMSMEEEEQISHVYKFPGLRVLDASHNNLTEIDHRAIGKSLEVFKASHNKINKIPPDTFSAGERLRRIELNANMLTSLSLKSIRLPSPPPPPASASSHHHHHHSNGLYGRRGGSTTPASLGPGAQLPMVEIFLADNPFVCDCDMEWLTRVNQLSAFRTHPFVTDMDRIKCTLTFGRGSGYTDFGSLSESGDRMKHAPVSFPLISKSLMEMNPQDFLCSYTTHCFALCHCCEFDACDCQMNCPEGCECFHDDNWSANVVNCAGSNHTSLPPQLPMDSTQVYLDGTHIRALKPHGFIGRKNLKMLFLNGTGMETIANKSFNGLISLQYLHLENNRLTVLKGYEFEQLSRVRELYLHNNLIRSIENNTFLSIKALEVLTLSGNQLVRFSVWQLNLNRNLIGVSLSSNPWDCHCDFVEHMFKWSEGNGNKVIGGTGNLKCVAGEPGSGSGFSIMDYNATCAVPTWALIPTTVWTFDLNSESVWFYCLIALLLLFWILMVLLWWFRDEIKYGIFSLCELRIPSPLCWSRDEDTNKLRCCLPASGNWDDDCASSLKTRDAYFLYSRLDEEFVRKRIVDELEDNCGYRLVLHYRDCCFLPPPSSTLQSSMDGSGTSTSVEESSSSSSSIPSSGSSGPSQWGLTSMEAGIKRCRSLVLVISPNFLTSEWMNAEFRESFLKSISEHKSTGETLATAHKSRRLSRAIVILRDDAEDPLMINSKHWMDDQFTQAQQLLAFLNSRAMRKRTVRWSEKSKTFWQKLKFLLPPPITPLPGKATKNTDEFTFHSGTTYTGHISHTIAPPVNGGPTPHLYIPSGGSHHHPVQYPLVPSLFYAGREEKPLENPLNPQYATGPNSIYASPAHTLMKSRHYDSNLLQAKSPLDVFRASRMSPRETLPSPSMIRQMNQRRAQMQSMNNNDYNMAPFQHKHGTMGSQPWAYASTVVGSQSPFHVHQKPQREATPPDPPAHFQEIIRNFSLQNYSGGLLARAPDPGSGSQYSPSVSSRGRYSALSQGREPNYVNHDPIYGQRDPPIYAQRRDPIYSQEPPYGTTSTTASSRNSSPPAHTTTDSTLVDSDNKSEEQAGRKRIANFPRLTSTSSPSHHRNLPTPRNPEVDYSDSEHEYECYGPQDSNTERLSNSRLRPTPVTQSNEVKAAGYAGVAKNNADTAAKKKARTRARQREVIRDSETDSRSSYEPAHSSDQEHVYFTLDTPSPTHKPLINDNESTSSSSKSSTKPSREIQRVITQDVPSVGKSPGNFTRSKIVAAHAGEYGTTRERSRSPYFHQNLGESTSTIPSAINPASNPPNVPLDIDSHVFLHQMQTSIV